MRTKNILLLAWVFVEIYLSLQHVVWRDEVRALSIALQGDSIYTMLMHLRGEGHPALWFLLLRMTHSFINRPEVLQIVSLSVAFASVLLLIQSWREIMVSVCYCFSSWLHIMNVIEIGESFLG